MVGLFCASLLISASALVFYGVPAPAAHDEFSNLLAADTFASGRLSNPRHPRWQHFESIHIVHNPTYMSKYPPGQGLFMAVGLVLVGQPIVGVWLSVALMIAALYWMLLAWMTPRWALLGGLFALCHFGVWGEWTESYWGAGVAGLGGALLLGGAGWLRRRDHLVDGAMIGLGMALLANSRPYEGLGAALPVAVALLWWSMRSPLPRKARRLLRVWSPLVALLGAGLMLLALYNQRVTGSPWTMTWLHAERQYATVTLPLLDLLGGGGQPNPVEFRHKVLEQYATYDRKVGPALRSMSGVPRLLAERIRDVWVFSVRSYLAPLPPAVLLLLPWLLRLRRLRLILASLGAAFVFLVMPTWHAERHFAPFAASALILVVTTLRLLTTIRIGRPRARRWVLAIYASLCLALAAWQTWQAGRSPQLAAMSWAHQRQRIQNTLASSGRHLVIVRYPSNHNLHQEWVYNAADIDAASVVWARDMDAQRNAELVAALAPRRAWLLEVPNEYEGAPTLRDFSAETSPRWPAADPASSPR